MTTPLEKRIIRQLGMTGQMSLAEYMHLCLSDPKDGYYKVRKSIGRDGDFITAPETSQMFGELLGVWTIQAWEQLGRPSSFNLVELGPGRGTLMSDLLRASRISPDFMAAANVRLVETSEKLKQEQVEKLIDATVPVTWHESLESAPDAPMLVIGNEFLDAIPIRQYVKTKSGWHERVIALDDSRKLSWALGTSTLDPGFLPKQAQAEPDGAVFEFSPAREAIVETLATCLKKNTGAALLVDYGHAKSGFGDTFQAVKSHTYADPLNEPGLADLTSHVDFDALSQIAKVTGADVKPLMTQSDFLLKLGLLERAGQLGHGKPKPVQERLASEVERLASSTQMGALFKVFAIVSRDIILPPFDDAKWEHNKKINR